jgi:uncharacterized membrane protein YecN with MAPEG domain
MILHVSAIFIASYALLIVALAINVSRLRTKKRVSLGDNKDGDPADYELSRARRAHGNAVENAVIMMPLVFVYEFIGGNALTLTILCGTFFFCRLVHASGLLHKATTLRRTAGALGSYLIEITLAVLVIVKTLSYFLGSPN